MIRARRAAANPQMTACVEVWGHDPVGSAQVEGVLARYGADLAGFTAPSRAGWGAPGSVEATDTHMWASPQAFNGLAGTLALVAMIDAGGSPIVFPQDAALSPLLMTATGSAG